MQNTASLKKITMLVWTVNACAICASTLSYIYLSYYIYIETGSLLYAQVVLFSPMILPVVFVAQIYRLSNSIPPRTVFIGCNAAALVLAIVLYTLLPSIALVAVVGGIVIGALDALQRVARIVAIKCYFSPASVQSTVPLTLTAQFIAGGIAGIAMALFKGQMMPWHALALTVGMFGAASVAALMLPRADSQAAAVREPPSALINAFSDLMKRCPSLRKSFLNFVIFISIYQGFFNVSRVTLPAHVLGLSEGYVGLLQAVNSFAALAGAALYYAMPKQRDKLQPLFMIGLSTFFMIAAALGSGIGSSYTAYFFFIFFFELAFFKLQADVVLATPHSAMPLVASVQYAGVYAGMTITILVGSLLVDAVGLLWTSIIFGACYLASTQRPR